MAKSGGGRGGPARRGRSGGAKRPRQRTAGGARTPNGKAGGTRQTPRADAKKAAAAQPLPDNTPRTLRLGAIPGATPGSWISRWRERMPHVELELVQISVADQRAALEDVDLAIVRLPIDDDSLHVIGLYEEVPVVVASVDSHLMAAETLTPADLDGEVLLVPDDDVFGPLDLPTAPFTGGALRTTEDAIATVASGVGIVVVPMSLARLHHRKDVEHRPLEGGSPAPVGIAWRRENTTADVEAFVGVVRGRTARSSR